MLNTRQLSVTIIVEHTALSFNYYVYVRLFVGCFDIFSLKTRT